jgi:ABC-type multidrug transport system ATPase subunit
LVAQPEVVFLDEPTTGLDPVARAAVWQVIDGLAAAGSTVLLTSQYLEEVDALARAVVLIDHGQVVAAGTPTELKRRVGGQRLVIRPAHPEQLVRTAAIMRDAEGIAAVVSADAAVTAGVVDPARIPRTLSVLDEAGIDLAELSLSLPTLDEVFLALTGARSVSAPEPS